MAKTKAKTKAAPKTKAVAAANPLEELVDLKTEIMDHIRKETQPGSETYAALWRED